MLLLRRVFVPVLSLSVLLGIAWLAPKLRSLPGGPFLNRSLDKIRSRDVNLIEFDILTAGYYEDLLDQGARTAARGDILRAFGLGKKKAVEAVDLASLGRRDAPFLGWEYIPNTDRILPGSQGRLMTNSFGMADREYALEKPVGTRRIAVLGDSVVRAWGVPMEEDFETLLENRLNEKHRNAGVQNFEVLNFSADGYRITQNIEVALQKAPPFSPDVYFLCLSDLSVMRHWGTHIQKLVRAKAPLKYDYLHTLAGKAELSPDDEDGLADNKLFRFRLPTIRWAIGEMNSQIGRDGSHLIILLVPSVSNPALHRDGFNEITELLGELGVPVIDLTDTFDNIPDLEHYRLDEQDRHPNQLGHQLLLENLYRKIQADSKISNLVLGTSNGSPRASR